MPPHHPLFGHVKLITRIIRRLPSHAHGHYLADQVRPLYPNLGPAFYLDAWPFGPRFLIVTSPDMIHQFTHDRYLPKHKGMRRFLAPLTGSQDLVSMEGQSWKEWRVIFNPGFSADHIMSLVPTMVDEVTIFRDILREHAKKRICFS